MEQLLRPARARHSVVVLAALVLAVGAACSGSRPTPPVGAAPAPVVVASFNFPESELVAEIYAQSLEHAGVPVRRQLDLGTREMVLPALHQGLVDVIPEYLGSALAALDPAGRLEGATTADERARLGRLLDPWHVRVLTPAPAVDQNELVVTAAEAARLGLRRVSDLAAAAPHLTLGGPAECPTRPLCLLGYQNLYGLHFSRFLPYDSESQRVSALEQQVVDVAVMFTTDGALAAGGSLVRLTDDRHLQPAENITPLVSDRALAAHGPAATRALDAVSAALSTEDVTFLNWRVGPGGKAIASEARGWLQRQGLLPHG